MESTERAVLATASCVRCTVKTIATVKGIAAAKSSSTTVERIHMRAIRIVVPINEGSAVRYVRIVVEGNVMVVPIESPVMPSPTVSTEEADSKP